MPTSYTSFIENGEVKDAKTFLHLCLRNFGVCIKLMDTPLKIQDDYVEDITEGYQHSIDFHQEILDGWKRNLEEIQKMSDDELCEKYISETRDEIKHLEECRDKDLQKYAEYLKIREEIESWNCDEEFEGIKKFAINQIDISISKSSYYDDELAKCGEPTREGFEKVKEEYRKKLIEDAEWKIDYHTEKINSLQTDRAKNLGCYERFKEDLNKLDKK